MINQALYFHAQFMSVSPAPRVTVSVTYDEELLTTQIDEPEEPDPEDPPLTA